LNSFGCVENKNMVLTTITHAAASMRIAPVIVMAPAAANELLMSAETRPVMSATMALDRTPRAWPRHDALLAA
jgi:hypothetical protein